MIRAFAVAALIASLGVLPSQANTDPDGNAITAAGSLHPLTIDTLTVELTWTAPWAYNNSTGYSGAATSYELRYSTTPFSWPPVFDSLTPASVSMPSPADPYQWQQVTVSGLTQGTSYYFVMRSNFIAASELTPGGMVTTATDAVPPAAVMDLAVTDVTASTVTLAWTVPADPDVTAFQIRYSTAGAITTDAEYAAATPALTVANALPSATVGSLAPSTNYWFAIRALDEVGNPSAVSANSPGAATSSAPGGDGGGHQCSATGAGMSLVVLLAFAALAAAHRF